MNFGKIVFSYGDERDIGMKVKRINVLLRWIFVKLCYDLQYFIYMCLNWFNPNFYLFIINANVDHIHDFVKAKYSIVHMWQAASKPVLITQ